MAVGLASASQVDRRDGKSDKKNKGRRDNLDNNRPGKGRGD